jgi:formylmethanofuran dehydrogenase subunit E
MEAAGARVAAANGQTVDELRAELAKIQDRECERCGETFATANVRKRVCSDSCRGKKHRERSGGES